MAITEIEKRDGTFVAFDRDKIKVAIIKAMKSINQEDEKGANAVTTSVVRELNKLDGVVGVEQIQDIVENKLMHKYPEVAKSYIKYREKRNVIRDRKTATMKQIETIMNCTDIQNSNANIDEYSFGGRKNEASNVIQKEYALNYLIDPEVADAYEKGALYIHDLSEYAVGMHNCLFIDFERLLSEGFSTRNGDVRPANSFATACQLTAVIFQVQSQVQFGGTASAHIDADLAPYVRKSFLKHYKKGLKWFGEYNNKNWEDFSRKYGDYLNTASIDANWNIFKNNNSTAYDFALQNLEEEGLQSTQALYHNLNTLESRSGSQVPFTSINFGLDTTFEGRCVTRWLLTASIDGIGKTHKTSIFPISIFQYKTDINDRIGTPNYDLKKLAIKSLSKRIYPNFVNCQYESNIPDVHPTYIIEDGVLQSLDDEANLRIDSNTGKDHQTEAFTTYNHDHKVFVSDYCTKKLGDLINEIPSDYISDPDANGTQVIDLRFTPNRYLIEDTTQKYNEYNIEANDHFTKINYLLVNKDEGTVCITTESFAYDIMTPPNVTKGVKVVSKHHIEIPKPKYNPGTEMATMGSCDGESVIEYKIDDTIVKDTFDNTWSTMRKKYSKVNSWRNSQYIETPGLYIYDSFAGDFVEVKRIIKNEDIGVWNKVIFEDDSYIWLTDDHPLPTERGRIYVKNIKSGDTVPVSKSDKRIKIKEIIHIGFRNRFGFDVETSSDHFDVDNINSHNCRTLIGYDVNGMGYDKVGRGNVTPATINLARIGIRHGICLGEREEADIDGFYKELDHLLDLEERELIQRFYFICSQNVRAGSFMYENGTIAGADEAVKTGKIYEAMKHGTNAFGYIGLANACYAMFGCYPHQDKNVNEFAINVIKRFKDKAAEFTKKYHLNGSAYASPCESTCYTLAKKLQKEFGKIKGVCDRSYLTNSHHVPVYENISVKDKIDFESQFCYMPTGGCITYVELNSGVMKNPKAVESIIDYAMSKKELPYFAINFPIDTCDDCGYTGDIEKECPICGSENIIRLRRVTGYLTTDYRKFNKGKMDEVDDRVKHG